MACTLKKLCYFSVHIAIDVCVVYMCLVGVCVCVCVCRSVYICSVCVCVCVCVCNSRSTNLSILNESCVVETLCNVLHFSDTVEECCIIEGMYKIHVVTAERSPRHSTTYSS